jgi:hypothetical protein
VNRVIQDGIQTGYPRATRLERPFFDPVRPVVILLAGLPITSFHADPQLAEFRLEQLVQQFA